MTIQRICHRLGGEFAERHAANLSENSPHDTPPSATNTKGKFILSQHTAPEYVAQIQPCNTRVHVYPADRYHGNTQVNVGRRLGRGKECAQRQYETMAKHLAGKHLRPQQRKLYQLASNQDGCHMGFVHLSQPERSQDDDPCRLSDARPCGRFAQNGGRQRSHKYGQTQGKWAVTHEAVTNHQRDGSRDGSCGDRSRGKSDTE